jgi:hypothetical protein
MTSFFCDVTALVLSARWRCTMTSQIGFFCDFWISDRHDVDLFPGDDICGLNIWLLLYDSLVRTGAIHRNSFRNFIMGVRLCPPLLKLWLKMAPFFQPSLRFLGDIVESDLCGVASGMGQGCVPRLAFGLHSAWGWGPPSDKILFSDDSNKFLCASEA